MPITRPQYYNLIVTGGTDPALCEPVEGPAEQLKEAREILADPAAARISFSVFRVTIDPDNVMFPVRIDAYTDAEIDGIGDEPKENECPPQ